MTPSALYVALQTGPLDLWSGLWLLAYVLLGSVAVECGRILLTRMGLIPRG